MLKLYLIENNFKERSNRHPNNQIPKKKQQRRYYNE